MATKKSTIDPKLGTIVKQFLSLKKKISAKNKEVEELKSQASELEKQLILELEAIKTERVDVPLGSVKLKAEPVFSVEGKDWGKVWKWIFKTENQDLFQHRLSQSAVRELVEDGVKIPGVNRMIKKSLSVGFKRGK